MESQESPETNVALIVGVTGMAGLSLAEALKEPNALGGPWRVYGAARRSKPDWFPSTTTDLYLTFDATSFEDTQQKLSPLAHQVTHVFWVAIQIGESEEANMTLNAAMLNNVLNVLKSVGSSSRLTHLTLQTGTAHYMGPLHRLEVDDPTFVKTHDTPFHEYLPRLPTRNFYYALEDLVESHAPAMGFTYTVHRPSIIIGASTRSVYNSLLTLAVYAAICRHEGSPFKFLGTRYTWEHFCDMSDAQVLAHQHIWAATTGKAKSEAFNCSNGDVFTWKSLWKVVCEVFEVEFVEFEEEDADVLAALKEKGEVWDEIVEENGLCKTKLEEITCIDALHAVLHFPFQHVSSMNKSREFGFHGHVDTFKSIRMWVGRLRDMKVIPY